MLRRDVITLATTAAALAVASPVLASGGGKKPEGETAAASVNIAGVGLPVTSNGRIRNYVFVTVKVHLGPGTTIEAMRAKDPFIRDALVRTAHRVSLAMPNDFTRMNENAINAAVMAIANVVVGHGGVTASEVLMQTPRRRTGVQQG
ncbi:hypothetical protein [Brevundimonas sp.]|uniref:hypothetical protein n=1 Tax=Brevundimonas sp. TaxID=1871086 RepID=UPI003BAC1E9B